VSKGNLNLTQALLRPLKLIWSLPQLLAEAFQRRRRQRVLGMMEAERLDRIRNPSKYRGK